MIEGRLFLSVGEKRNSAEGMPRSIRDRAGVASSPLNMLLLRGGSHSPAFDRSAVLGRGSGASRALRAGASTRICPGWPIQGQSRVAL